MPYRNHVLLGLARVAPCCFSCLKSNDGDVVACHGNSLSDGKGLGMKASDARVAFACGACHQVFDQSKINGEDRRRLWELAHMATVRWLIESGHLVASVEPVAPPPPKPKIKRTIAKGPKIASRGFDNTIKRKIPSRPFPKR